MTWAIWADMSSPPAGTKQLTDLSTLIGGAGLSLFGLGARAVLLYAHSFLVVRLLGPSGYGIYVLAVAVITILSQVSELGLRRSTVRFVAMYAGQGDLACVRGVVKAAVLFILTVGTLVGTILFAMATPLAGKLLGKPELVSAFRLLAPIVPLLALVNIGIAYTQAFRVVRFKVIVQDLLMPGLELALALTLVILGWSTRGVLAAFVCSVTVGAVAIVILSQRQMPWIGATQATEWRIRPLFRFALPVLLADVLLITTARVNVLLIGRLMSTQDVGVFNIALQTTLLGTMFLNSVNLIFAPTIADLVNRGETERLLTLYRESTRWVLMLALPLYVGLALVAHPLMAFFGPQFAKGATALAIIAAAQIVNVGVGSVGLLILMSGHPEINLANAALNLVLNLGLNWLLIPRYGLVGSAVAYGLMLAIANLVSLTEVHGLLKLHPFSRDYFKPLLAGALALLLAWVSSHFLTWPETALGQLTKLALFAVIYVSSLLWFGLTQEDRYLVSRVRSMIFKS